MQGEVTVVGLDEIVEVVEVRADLQASLQAGRCATGVSWVCEPGATVTASTGRPHQDVPEVRASVLNAGESVRSVDQAQALASTVTLVRRQFPAAKANLTPWRDDPQTRQWTEPESLDLSFHFPGWSPRLQCRSLLMQLRFHPKPPGSSGNCSAC